MFHTLVVLVAAGEVQEVSTVIDVRALAVLGSVLVPLLVQLLVKKTASEGVKAALALLGSVLVTVLAFVIDPGDTVVNFTTVINVFITTVVAQLTAYLAVFKPLGIAGTIAEKTKGFGIGSPPNLQTADVGQEENPVYATQPEDDHLDIQRLIGAPADDNVPVPPYEEGQD